MRIKIKSIEYSGYNLIIYDEIGDSPLDLCWYLVAIEDSLGKELFTRSPIKDLETALAEGKKIVDRRFLGKTEPRNAIEIFVTDDGKSLDFIGEELASELDYEFALEKHQSEQTIFDILQPGQDVILLEGKFCLDDDLSLLVYE
jgi:hypothetical protein